MIFAAINIFSKGKTTMADNTTINPNTDPELPQPTTEETPSPTEQDVIDAESDAELKLQAYAAQQEQEAGSSPNEQDVIAAEEDPFEAARMQRAQDNTDEAPTEQAVIDAGAEPVSEDEQAVLDSIAADNRAKLAAEEQYAGINATTLGLAGSVDQARQAQTVAVQRNSLQKDDWRLRLSLAKGAKYLYNQPGITPNHILYPLKAKDGIIFPYTPQIGTSYRANYDPSDLTHSNYKMFFYKNSAVDDISITADFTAQDTEEANYLLAVIHFFKSATKMFYGQDPKNGGPRAGTPPPLCYLNGFGPYQFSEHPVLISSFSYQLPNDVDYIRAGITTQNAGTNTGAFQQKGESSGSSVMSWLRMMGNNLTKGSSSGEPQWKNLANAEATYVPTKIQIQLNLHPVATRNDVSKNFSLADYASGKLIKGRERTSGGFW